MRLRRVDLPSPASPMAAITSLLSGSVGSLTMVGRATVWNKLQTSASNFHHIQQDGEDTHCDLFLAREEVCDNRGVMQDVSVRYAGG